MTKSELIEIKMEHINNALHEMGTFCDNSKMSEYKIYRNLIEEETSNLINQFKTLLNLIKRGVKHE